MKRQLWLRLKKYHFDNLVPPQLLDHVRSAFGSSDPSTQAFASKVARKLHWDRRFAMRAIEEYRKFVYLGIIADFSVTPPKVIDQVWHEHLLFSRAYREFCRDVLERDFDHNPELVPLDDQTGLYHAQYDATLELYRAEFNRRPPKDIWGTTKFRPDGTAAPEVPRRRTDDVEMAFLYNETPLYQHFSDSGPESHHQMSEFGDSGDASGGGGGDTYDGSSSDSGSDSGSSDSGSSDSGSSCSSGSSCGSSCSSSD